MRRVLPLTALLALALAAPAQGATPAPENTAFRACGAQSIARCGNVVVPLDRPAASRAIGLRVRRILVPGQIAGLRRGVVFALAGGPGQAATPFAEYLAFRFRKALSSREVVTFDQRGTGHSAIIRCPTLEALGESLLRVAGAAADCAETLGASRSLYTTGDSVEDLEAVRRAVHADKVTLYGTSYGTKLALAYAAAYPNRVESLVLDSVVATNGPDPFLRESLEAIPRVLRQLCGSGCSRFTKDPIADLTALTARLARGLLRGPLVRGDGRPHPARLGRIRLLDLLFAGDFDPALRVGAPAAIRSALDGDAAPILRLARRASATFYEPVSYFNPAVYAATVCEEGPLPWARTSPLEERVAQARALFDATPGEAIGGFDRLSAFVASPALQLCRMWPSASAEPAIRNGPFPNVPALVISGEDDIRTPLETAEAVAKLLPRAVVVSVPEVGHSALDWPNAGCARRALREFLARRPVEPCARRKRLLPAERPAPTALSQLRPAHGVPGRAGRTLAAVERTLADAGAQVEEALFALSFIQNGVPGLRGGLVKVKQSGFGLERLEYVPGVKLSGELKGFSLARGSVRVYGDAAAAGRLALRDGILSGRLGGRRVRLAIPAEFPRIGKGDLGSETDLGSSWRRTPYPVSQSLP